MHTQLALFWYDCTAEERDAYAGVLIFLVLSGEDTVAPAAFEVIVHDIVKDPTTPLPRTGESDEELRDAVAIEVMEKLRAVGRDEDSGEPQPWRRLALYHETYTGGAGKFRAWLKVVAYRTAVDLLRRNTKIVGGREDRRRSDIPFDDWDGSGRAVEEWAAQTPLPMRIDAIRTLQAAGKWLRTLPAGDREVLCLRVDDGLGHREIAARVGSTPEAVRKRIARLRGRLRHHLSRSMGA
ncbi:RNA polymerase sigma factor [Haliangium sp.]|uniref:RNA polymerase sigma factor n=1 Tax=Haliangium sp. TaxID=2663208 RepID=UPI003D0CDF6F